MSKKRTNSRKTSKREPGDGELTITLTLGEVAAISQRALAEKLCGRPWEVFSGLWRRIERQLERAA